MHELRLEGPIDDDVLCITEDTKVIHIITGSILVSCVLSFGHVLWRLNRRQESHMYMYIMWPWFGRNLMPKINNLYQKKVFSIMYLINSKKILIYVL